MDLSAKQSTTEVVLRDITIGLIQKYWNTKPYVKEAATRFLRNITIDLIKDLEQSSNLEQNKVLIAALKALQGDQVQNALKPLGEALKKVDYWKPETSSEAGQARILADEIIDLLKNFGPSSLGVLLDAFLDDTDFDSRLAKLSNTTATSNNLPVEKEFKPNMQRSLILSYKFIKNQRLAEEIEAFRHIALDFLTERLKQEQPNNVSKIRPMYEKLSKLFSISQKTGYELLL